MKIKTLTGLLLLFLCSISIASCKKEDVLTDKIKIIQMYVSNETDSYTPWGSENPVECMLVKEENMSEYSKVAMNGILGFNYEKGHEYVLKIEKTILAKPANDIRYKLLEIINDNVVNTTLVWDTFIDDSKEDEIDISSKYNGVQGWWDIANTPYIYVGAVFPENSFATSFDKEITDKKQPINLCFDFTEPYIAMMNDVRQNEYNKIIKEVIRSKEYQNFKYPTRPYIAKLTELKSLENVELYIDDNENFASILKKMGNKEFDMNNTISLCLGKVIFKGFTVSMDIPEKGIFVENPTNKDNLVYLRTLTYGTSAYFLIASKYPYNEIVSSLKGPFVKKQENEKILNNSQIILLTISDIRQTADISNSFEALQNYLNNPFMSGETYGYPIFCKGMYVKDNSTFIPGK